ncbi:uncharacterized protein PHACADRAFT_213459 [Phanerochaete carnosa HHB-10118-sp]|uniref:Spt20-like SEP domain-containing protein n=1 Tax=Phanerochaete carnosa (strain HHB-10118-sp) TaxID=650164 RepID=K5WJV6_PHACS|nr:uncharacterized protein PHACADRAFT_213459 [Phanerochaete carnosa HHB-10118-sp]EKM50542.1 hypothetical protein PHACADRAFT_213459 [Phanerochaete carnosa HHB-10118-sp]
MTDYNVTRSVEGLLAQHESSPPSFTVHLYPEHWTLNNGSKFLYNNQVASLLDDIRAQRIPADFLELFDSANLPFYEGCMIVELLDYRPQKVKDPILVNPERSRAVLMPNPETLWADICLLNQKAGSMWTDQESLKVEAQILVATAPPLCLDPDPHLARMASHVLRVSVPKTPPSLKRKAAAMEHEEEESDKARRVKISQYLNPRHNRSTPSNYHILEIQQKTKESKPNVPPAQPEPILPAQLTAPPANPDDAGNYGINPTSLIKANPSPLPLPQSTTHLPSIMPAPSIPAPPTGAALSVPSGQPVKTVRQSPRPPSTVPQSAIPPHMQMYPIARNTPPPPQLSQTPMPRPPSSVSIAPQASPVMRSSSVQQPLQHTNQQIQQHPPGSQMQSPAMQPAQQIPTAPQTQPPAQPTMPNMPNIQLPTTPQTMAMWLARLQNKPEIAASLQRQLSGMTQEQQQKWLAQQQARMFMLAQQQARLNANGPATPAQSASPRPPTAIAGNQGMQQQPQQPQQPTHSHPQQPQQHQPQQHQPQQHQPQQQVPQQSSPMHVNQPLARSPMPNNAQVQQMPLQQAQAYSQYATMAQAQNHQFNPALHRPAMASHTQLMPHIANVNAQAGGMLPQQQGQDQAAAAAAAQAQAQAMMQGHYPMYNYPQMGMNMQQAAAAGRMPQYWPAMGIGRGMPPGMLQPHAQQMQMGNAKGT